MSENTNVADSNELHFCGDPDCQLCASLQPTAAETAEIMGAVTGARESRATVERVTYEGGVRQVELIGEARWSRMIADTYGPGLMAVRDRQRINRRVRSVFEQAQQDRWRLGQIQDPAIRDALSLT